MNALVNSLPDPILSVIATVVLFWQYTVMPTLRSLVQKLTYVAFIPMFGVGGSHFMTATSYQGNKHRVNWMAYSVLARTLVIQIHKGKTVYTYSVRDVGPMAYLSLVNDTSVDNVQALLTENPTYEVRWTWRYDGVYRKGIKRPNANFPAAPRRPGQRG